MNWPGFSLSCDFDPKWVLGAFPAARPLLAKFGAILGPSWRRGRFGPNLARFELFWSFLGGKAFFGNILHILVNSGAFLAARPFWAKFGPFWAILGPQCVRTAAVRTAMRPDSCCPGGPASGQLLSGRCPVAVRSSVAPRAASAAPARR